MDQVDPLYNNVIAGVLASVTQQWTRYGWEESEVERRVEKLKKVQSNTRTTKPNHRSQKPHSSFTEQQQFHQLEIGGSIQR